MTVRFAAFTFDSDRRQVLDTSNAPVAIRPKAFDLLALLIERAPRVVSKAELHQRLWPETFVSDATLVGLVKDLRQALDDHASTVIRTSHGAGYAFSAPVTGMASAPVTQWVVASDRRIALREGPNVIGRDPGATVWLDTVGVSRRHARIVIAGREAHLEDLGSKNGTRLRGTIVTSPEVLRDGDTFLIGPLALQYRVSSSGMSTQTVDTSVV